MGETWARRERLRAKSLMMLVGAVGATYHLTGKCTLAYFSAVLAAFFARWAQSSACA
jgi:hypothetical protein